MITVRLLGASSTFLRQGQVDLKAVGSSSREEARGQNTQRGLAEESEGCLW